MEKSKTIFDILNDITFAKVLWKDQLESTQKKVDKYMINRWLSMKSDYMELVAGVQSVTERLDQKQFYQFYQSIIPKKKFFTKYIKQVKKLSYNHDLLKLIANHYDLSIKDAMILIDNNKRSDLITFVKSFGYKPTEYGL